MEGSTTGVDTAGPGVGDMGGNVYLTHSARVGLEAPGKEMHAQGMRMNLEAMAHVVKLGLG